MQTQKTTEDYLEAMLMMKEKNGYIRSIDVAEHMGVTKPSVSYTVKRLRENGFLTMADDGEITLTPSGMKIASDTYGRHKLLTGCLIKLGVDELTAAEDACKIEHDVSEQTFQAIKKHVDSHK